MVLYVDEIENVVDDEFEREYRQMMSETSDVKVGANQESSKVNESMHINSAMLSKIQTRDHAGDGSDDDGDDARGSPTTCVDPTAMKFRFLKKTKGKLQAVSLAVPGQAAAAERIKKYAETEKAERDEIKNFVLNYNETVVVISYTTSFYSRYYIFLRPTLTFGPIRRRLISKYPPRFCDLHICLLWRQDHDRDQDKTHCNVVVRTQSPLHVSFHHSSRKIGRR